MRAYPIFYLVWLVVEQGLHRLSREGSLAERSLRGASGGGGGGGGGGSGGGGGGGLRGRRVRVHVAEREYAIVQRVCVRTTRPPRATPPHFALLREHLLHVKREAAQPHVPPPAVSYHELHCKQSPITTYYAIRPPPRPSKHISLGSTILKG